MVQIKYGEKKIDYLYLFLFVMVGQLSVFFFKKILGGYDPILMTFEKLMFVAFFSIVCLLNLKKAFTVVAFYLVYIVFSMFLSAFKGVDSNVIFYQMLHELKLFLFLPVIYLSIDNKDIHKYLVAIIKVVAVLSSLLLILRVVSSGFYDSVFPGGSHHEKAFLGGFVLDRYVGIFWHPSQTSIVIGLSLFYFALIREKIYWMLMLSGILLLTFQKLEIFCVCLMVVATYVDRNTILRYKKIISAVVIILMNIVIYVVIQSDEVSPRALVFKEAFVYLQDSNYIGNGWGVIGSHAAADINRVYDYNYLSDLWWAKDGKFLYDTYWPHVYAESGAIGFLLLMFTFLLLSIKAVGVYGYLVILFLLVSSVFSSNLLALPFLIVFAFYYAVCVGYEKNNF